MPVLATCVKMQTYSLQRYRHLKPAPPFALGGIYAGGNRLMDALGTVEIEVAPELCADLQPGDLVTFHILTAPLKVSRVSLEYRPRIWAANAPSHAKEFAEFVQSVRNFLVQRGLNEIFTPTLVACPGMEPSLEPFITRVTKGREERIAHLPTSPEIHLKKAMAQGWTDIFEIKSCFRRGEYSEHHDHEFTMLEWYRAFADLDDIVDDLAQMLQTLCGQPVQVTDFASLFKEELNFELTPKTTANELKPLCQNTHESDTFTDLFHRILIEKIEPAIAKRGALIVRRFPPEMAALAKLDSQGWADRFELYWNGLEIANAFNEVTDANEQMERWKREAKERARLGTTPLPHDEEMIDALRKGLPPSGGIALGMERLFMAWKGVKDIRELKLFPGINLFR